MSAKRQHIEKLAKLVAEEVATNPHQRGSFKFAACPLSYWAEQLGVSNKSVSRYFDDPIFYTEQAAPDGKPMVVVRILAPGESPRKSEPRIANELRIIWEGRHFDQAAIKAKIKAGKPTTAKEKDGKWIIPTTGDDHGCLVGLAELWGEEWAHKILLYTLQHWADFKACVKITLATEQDAKTGDPDLEVESYLYHQYPHLPTIRRFHAVARELFKMELQAKAGAEGWGTHSKPNSASSPKLSVSSITV